MTPGRARGATIGSLFFSIFGTLWLVLSAYYFHVLILPLKLALATIPFIFILLAIQLLRVLPTAGPPNAQQRRDARRFNWVNLGQWVAILVVSNLAVRLHHAEYSVPLAVLIVGLHFFAMAPSYRSPPNLFAGISLCLGAILCTIFFRSLLTATVTLWAGVTLCCAAAWSIALASGTTN